MKFFARLLPRSITAQITGIVTVSVLLGMILTVAITFFLVGDPASDKSPPAVGSRIENVTRFIRSAKTSADIDAILEAVRNSGVWVERIPQSKLVTSHDKASGLLLSFLSRRHASKLAANILENVRYADGPAEQLIVRLDEGYALVFDAAVEANFSLLFLTPTALLLTIILISILLLSLYAVRWIIAPLSAVAEATLSFGRSPRDDYAISSGGPREISQVADALNEMRQKIRTLLQDRTAMLAAISHDLRTPLTRLRLRTDRVADPDLRDSMLADLANTDRMLDETLDYLREDGKFEAVSLVDLPSLLQTICSEFADVGHEVTYEGPFRLAWSIRPRAMARAIANIVDNAVKHGTRVQVTLHGATAKGVEIRISDDGPGIPGEIRDKVFDPFFKADSARRRDSGVGLGLSIARDVVKQHSGEIELLQRDPTGLTVQIMLPTYMSLNMN